MMVRLGIFSSIPLYMLLLSFLLIVISIIAAQKFLHYKIHHHIRNEWAVFAAIIETLKH